MDGADASIIVMQYSAIKYLKIFYICFAPDFSTSDTLKSVQLFTVDGLHLQKYSLNFKKISYEYKVYLLPITYIDTEILYTSVTLDAISHY